MSSWPLRTNGGIPTKFEYLDPKPNEDVMIAYTMNTWADVGRSDTWVRGSDTWVQNYKEGGPKFWVYHCDQPKWWIFSWDAHWNKAYEALRDDGFVDKKEVQEDKWLEL